MSTVHSSKVFYSVSKFDKGVVRLIDKICVQECVKVQLAIGSMSTIYIK